MSCLKHDDLPSCFFDGACWQWQARTNERNKVVLQMGKELLLQTLVNEPCRVDKSFVASDWLYQFSPRHLTRKYRDSTEKQRSILVQSAIIDYYGKTAFELNNYLYDVYTVNDIRFLRMYENSGGVWKIKQILKEIT